MIDPPSVVRHRAVVGDPLGLRLRTVEQFVRLAQHYDAEIRVCCGGVAARARSLLDLMGLVAEFGMFLELEAQGPDAEEAVDALAELISAQPAEGEG